MPKIIEDRKTNLVVYIYTNDHEPARVHVFRGRKTDTNRADMKIYIGSEEEAPKLIETHSSLKNKDIVNAILLVAENQEMLLEKWREIHET